MVGASDTVSNFLGIPASCQSYAYAISTVKNSALNALTATELAFDSSSGVRLISLYTANSLAIGTHTATVTVSLPSYSMVPQVMANF